MIRLSRRAALLVLVLAACGEVDDAQPSADDAGLDAAAPDAAGPDAAASPDAGASSCSPSTPAACAYQPAQLYPADAPHVQQVVRYRDVTGAMRTVAIELRRAADAPAPLPIVIWSHGGASGRSDPSLVGEEIGAPISAAGYLGVFVAHPPRSGVEVDALCLQLGIADADCRSGTCTIDPDCGADSGGCLDGECLRVKHLSWDRPNDVAAVIDWLETEAAGPLAGAIDTSRIAYAGHSSGAGATMMVAGATRQFAGVDRLLLDPRPIAFVSASPQGPGDEGFTEDSFTGAGCAALASSPALCLTRPHLVLTGVGDDTDTTGEKRRRTFDLMPGGDQHLLWLLEEAARHTTFELKTDACADYAASHDLDAALYPARCGTYLTWLRSAMVAFLDAHLRGRPEARVYLESDDLGVLAAGAASWESR